jgi:phosphoribosylamine--glycine ligase
VGENHRILIVGGGGREHAIAWRLGRDADVGHLCVAPGNDGIARSIPCHAVAETDPAALLDLCRAERVTLAVIGPEAPLAAGLADHLSANGIPTFGPSAAAARLESSKWAAKQIMEACGVPTARARLCGDREEGLRALGGFDPPWVLKADGLAAGKGVLVTRDRAEAEAFLAGCLDQARFGAAGRQVVIEEHLMGEEASLMAVCDGERFVALPAARDYKRARDGDRGPNTGGMGAFAPAPRVSPALEAEIGRIIVRPVLEEMAARGTPYRGVLYVGLMLTASGPRVVEFNCRFGDPETQVIMARMRSDIVPILQQCASGTLGDTRIEWAKEPAVCVVLASKGYPDTPETGKVISGLDALKEWSDVVVYHAATKSEDGAVKTVGGRVLGVTALGANLESAIARASEAIDRVKFDGMLYRRDIGARALAHLHGPKPA